MDSTFHHLSILKMSIQFYIVLASGLIAAAYVIYNIKKSIEKQDCEGGCNCESANLKKHGKFK